MKKQFHRDFEWQWRSSFPAKKEKEKKWCTEQAEGHRTNRRMQISNRQLWLSSRIKASIISKTRASCKPNHMARWLMQYKLLIIYKMYMGRDMKHHYL